MGHGTPQERKQVNGWLRQWAIAVIVARPGTYLVGVATDFSKYLRAPWDSLADVWILKDPSERFFPGFSRMTPPERADMTKLRNAYLPGYVRVVDPPPVLRFYQRWLEMPGWLLTYLALFSLLVVVGFAAARKTLPHTAEIILVLATALSILVGAVATSQYQDRFVPSVIPLLVVGVTLVAHELTRLLRRAS